MSNPTITLVGRIGSDPEKVGKSDNKGLKFRMATNQRGKNDQGEWVDKNTSWWSVKAWNGLAERSVDILKKGQSVIVTGVIYEQSWKDAEGNNKTSYEIVAEDIAVSVRSLSDKKPMAKAVNDSFDVNSLPSLVG